MELNLNDNDNKLLGFCRDISRSVGEIARFLDVTPASISIKIKNLEREGLINIERNGKGKKTFVRTKSGIKIKEYYLTLLSEIKKRKGITKEEFFSILPFDPTDPKARDKINAQMTLKFVTPKLIETKFFITKEGEEYLKKFSKKN